MRSTFAVAVAVAVTALACASCTSSPARVEQPDYAAAAGVSAVSQLDRDGDGAIANDELDAAPGLQAALKKIDADGDQRLTAEEIDARVESWRASRVAELAVSCRVLLDGTPLEGAKLEFEPEPFLGGDLHPAYAMTDASGSASVSLAAEHLDDPRYPGVAPGWYRVQVTASEWALPPRYNTETTLGCEIASDATWVHQPGEVVLHLTSR